MFPAKSIAQLVISSVLAALVTCGLCRQSAADDVLRIDNDTLTSYLYASGSQIQNVRPGEGFRVVSVTGATRYNDGNDNVERQSPPGSGGLESMLPKPPSSEGQSGGGYCTAHPGGILPELKPRSDGASPVDANEGGVRLDTGTFPTNDIDIALPSDGFRWLVGRSYNSRQASSSGMHYDSDGPQGRNWFQSSQPEIVLYEGATNDKDVVYMLLGADRYAEYKRESVSSDFFRGVNGATGVFIHETGATGEPDTYTYIDISSVKIVFFGFDGDASPAEGQLWKITRGAHTAYIGHETMGSTAISNGFDAGGRMTTAYDTAGRKYTYTYTSVEGTQRLTEVKVYEDVSSQWIATGDEVDYEYYDSTDNTHGDYGCLKLVTVTTPLSDSGTNSTRSTYYRYYKGAYNATTNPGYPYGIKYIFDSEGIRRFDWAGDSTFDDDHLTATNDDLKPYASAYLSYDSKYRIAKAWTNGQCGCEGAPEGVHVYTYEDNTSYTDTAGYQNMWASRAVVGQPIGTYRTVYFDETGQTLSEIRTEGDPATNPGSTWVVNVQRNTDGTLSKKGTPAALKSYTHSTGAISLEPSTGLVYHNAVKSSGDMAGFFEESAASDGETDTEYLGTRFTWTSRDLKLDGTTNLTVPLVASVANYPDEVDTADGNTVYEIEFTYTYYSNASATPSPIEYIQVETVTMTHEAVSTANNGSGLQPVSKIHYTRDGKIDFYKSIDGIITYYEYAGGVLVKQIEDADTTKTGAGEDFEIVTIPTGFSSTGNPYHRVTTYSHDAQGRVVTVTPPSGPVSHSYYSQLADGRQIILTYADYKTTPATEYYGPVRFAIYYSNGLQESSGIIVLSENSGEYTSATQSEHVDETKTSPIEAIASLGTITNLRTHVYDEETGTQLTEVRMYHNTPNALSYPGTQGTNYDVRYYGYDDAGRRSRVKDPTGTITRIIYDELGRPYETHIGTNDSNYEGGEATGTDNMTRVSMTVYDEGAAGGNSLVTSRTVYTDASTSSTTSYRHDVYGRTVLVENPVEPTYILTKYDNYGRVIAVGTYDGNANATTLMNDDPIARTSDRLSLTETFYDERGRAFKTARHKITLSTGVSADSLVDQVWYDDVGRTIKTTGSQITKIAYDRLGRATHQFLLAETNDTTYADADDVSGDIVLSESQTVYDPNIDQVIMAINIDRHHDDKGVGETTGALDTNVDGDALKYTASDIEGRIQIMAMWYDDFGRQTDVVNYGTYNESTFDRDDLSVPVRSDTTLLTEMAYDAAGRTLSVTNPRDHETRYAYDDAGRTITEIRNYVNGYTSGMMGKDDQHKRYVYENGMLTKLWIDVSVPNDDTPVIDTNDQVTEYIYGTTKGTSAGDSKIATGYLLQSTKYPDSSGANDVVSQAYDAQGMLIWQKDQAGNVIETEYDGSRRPTARKITTLISPDYDGAVRRIVTAYNTRGQVSTITQYDAATGGNVVDQVKFTYDDWGGSSKFEQDHDSAVGGTLLYDVELTYHKSTSGWTDMRRSVMTYPDGSTVVYDYSTLNNRFDNAINRVTSVVSGTGRGAVTHATYAYNGLGHVVETTYPVPSLFKPLYDTGNGYPHIDRFNRIIEDLWYGDPGKTKPYYDIDITYDRNSNITWIEDNVFEKHDFKYTMDDLDRLSDAERGVKSQNSINQKQWDEAWALDQLGNWDLYQLDRNGDGSYTGSHELQDDRTHNVVNELTARDTDNDDTNDYTLTYDDVGNLIDDGEHYEYVYDPFGRLRKILDRSNDALVQEYWYNGLGYRIATKYDSDGDDDVDGTDPTWRFIYDTQWRIIQMYRNDDANPRERFVYHAAGQNGRGTASYIDDVMLRDRDVKPWNVASDSTMEERVFYCQNFRHDVIALIDNAGDPVEYVRYSPYGEPYGYPAGDADLDGDVDSADMAKINNWRETSVYSTLGDLDFDGDVDTADVTICQNSSGNTAGRAVLSIIGSSRGYAGYAYLHPLSSNNSIYYMRHRYYCASLGMFYARDLLGSGSFSLYGYVSASPLSNVDPSGLIELFIMQPQEMEELEEEKYGAIDRPGFIGENVSTKWYRWIDGWYGKSWAMHSEAFRGDPEVHQAVYLQSVYWATITKDDINWPPYHEVPPKKPFNLEDSSKWWLTTEHTWGRSAFSFTCDARTGMWYKSGRAEGSPKHGMYAYSDLEISFEWNKEYSLSVGTVSSYIDPGYGADTVVNGEFSPFMMIGTGPREYTTGSRMSEKGGLAYMHERSLQTAYKCRKMCIPY
jgi:RHS repeat-associated protein